MTIFHTLNTFTVTSYDAWRSEYETGRPLRERYGVRKATVFQDRENPNKLSVLTEFETKEQAMAMMQDPEWRAMIERSDAVTGRPELLLAGVGEEFPHNPQPAVS
jgi:quinol monooxygenase YgiN